jgi:hypothetical protein
VGAARDRPLESLLRWKDSILEKRGEVELVHGWSLPRSGRPSRHLEGPLRTSHAA